MAKYKLDELCEFITDGTHQTPEYCEEGGVIFLSSKDVTERKINWDDVKYIPESLHQKLYKRLSPKLNDILLAKNGTTGVAAIVDRDEIFDVYVSLAVLRPLESVYPKYLLYAINSPVAKRQFNAGLKGIGVPNLHLGVIRETVVNVAPRDEQEKICEILDKVASMIDGRKAELLALDDLIKARFVELFGDESIYDKEMLNDNVHEMFIGPFGSALKNEYFVAEEDSYCMVYEQKHAIQKTMDLPTRYIDEKKYNDLKRFTVQGGDIIVSCRGTIGEIYSIPKDAPIGVMHPSIMKIRLKNEKYCNLFFVMMLNQYMRENIAKANGSGIKMAVTATDLGREYFIVPPMSKQNEFADFVHQVDKSKAATSQPTSYD